MDDFEDALAALGEKPKSAVSPAFLKAIVAQESGGNPNAVSPKGARGVMQVMPGTNTSPGYGVAPARDNSEGERTRVGQDYLGAMHARYKDPALASIAYNMGPDATDKWLQSGGHFDKLPAETRNYVGSVMTKTAVNTHQGSTGAPQPAAKAAQPAPQDDDFASAINALSAKSAPQPVAPVQAPAQAQAPAKPSSFAQTLSAAVPIPAVKIASMLGQKYAPKTANSDSDTSAITDFGKRLGSSAVALGDTVAGGIGGAIKQIEYAGSRAYGNTPEEATRQSNSGVGAFFENPVSKFVNGAGKLLGGSNSKVEDSAGYKSEASQKAMQFVGDNMAKGADWISSKTGLPKADVENMMNTALAGVTPAIGKGVSKAAIKTATAFDGWNQELSGSKPLSSMLKAGEAPTAVVAAKPSAKVNSGWNSELPQGSVGAAGTSLDSKFSQASPKLQKAYAEAKKDGPINPVSAERHLAADSLNAGVELMPGQASGSIHLISDENNLRAKRPDYADRFNAQNEGLKKKLDTIRDEISPDVYSPGPTSRGENQISAYEAKDAALKKDITANYADLEAANGGHFPMDTKAFLENSDAMLKKKMKTAYVPKEIAAQLEGFRNGDSMNFEQHEALRTNLASDIRKAKRAGDGNAAYAAGIVRDALEAIPLTPETAHLKPLADKARASAERRFKLIEKDPAYDAAINGTVTADKFMDKFVIGGSKENVKIMRENLAHDPMAQQQMGHHTVEWLKKSGGLVEGNGTLSQAGYNKNLTALHEKLGDLVGPEAAISLRTVGDVARWTQVQPKGSYVNNSGTLVTALKHGVVGAAEGTANAIAPFFGIGTAIRNKIDNRAVAQSTKKALEPGAGLVNLKDIGK